MIPSLLTSVVVGYLLLGWLCMIPNPIEGQDVPLQKVLEIERAIIESRQSISSGIVRISTKRPVDEIPDLRGLEKHYVNQFDGGTFRWDTTENKLRHTFVYGPKGSIEGNHDRLDPFLVFNATTKADKPRGATDALRLGFVCWYFPSLREFGYDEHFLRGDRTEFVAKFETRDGEKLLKVEYDYIALGGVGAHAEYELLVENSYMPKRISSTCTVKGITTVSEVHSTWKKYEGDVWYPTETTYQSIDNGVLKNQEVTTVESAKFNLMIPPTEFELEGIGLKVGQPIDIDGRISYWTGSDLTREPILVGGVSPLRRRIFLLAAIVFSAILIVLVIRNFRDVKTPKS